MSKISTYDNASPVSLSDRLIGTSVGATPANSTKNFLVSDILSLFESNLSNAYVLMTLGSATNAQATTITIINTPVQVDLNSLAVATEAQGFSVANDGTITCTHTQNIVGKISVSISHLSPTGNDDFKFLLKKDSTVIESSGIVDHSGNNITSVNLSYITSISNGTTFQLWVENISGTHNVTVTNIQFSVHE